VATVKLTKSVLREAADAPPETGRRYVWDSEVRGFGARVMPSGAVSFVLSYRTRDGTKRQPVIGAWGGLTLEEARGIARDWTAEVRRGGDPSRSRAEARAGATVAEVATAYLEWCVRHRKPAHASLNRRYLERFILPRWGAAKLSSIGVREVEALHRDLADHPVTANRVRALVSHVWSMAELWGMVEGANPARRVHRYPERPTHRPLGAADLEALGAALDVFRVGGEERAEALDMIEALLLTGCRKSEIVRLTWGEVDLGEGAIRLRDAKGGPRVVWLGADAVALLERRRVYAGGDPSPEAVVFPSPRRDGAPWRGLQKAWERIRRRAGLDGVRLHDLRHTAGARGAELGLGQAQIGALLGHRTPSTTARYSEPHRDPAARSAALVAGSIARDLAGRDDDGDGE
jgi:integrase